jgi:hypothetical protein
MSCFRKGGKQNRQTRHPASRSLVCHHRMMNTERWIVVRLCRCQRAASKGYIKGQSLIHDSDSPDRPAITTMSYSPHGHDPEDAPGYRGNIAPVGRVVAGGTRFIIASVVRMSRCDSQELCLEKLLCTRTSITEVSEWPNLEAAALGSPIFFSAECLRLHSGHKCASPACPVWGIKTTCRLHLEMS